MAANSNDSLQIRYSDPIYLNVTGAVDDLGNSSVGGYLVYVVKTPLGETAPSLSGLNSTQKLEHVATIYPETAPSYSGRTNIVGDTPIYRRDYSPTYIYPIEYRQVEENKDHYFYLTAFDKNGNVNSGLVALGSNPLRGPSVQARAVQFTNTTPAITIYNSGLFFPTNAYPSGTISMWITTPSQAPSVESNLICKVASNRVPAPFAVHMSTAFKLLCLLGSASNSGPVYGTNYEYWESTALQANRTYHAAFTWKKMTGSSVSGIWYLNGAQVSQVGGFLIQGVSGFTWGNTLVGTETVATAVSGLIIDGIHFYTKFINDTEAYNLYSGQLHGSRDIYLQDSLHQKYSFDEGSGLFTYANYPVVTPPISGVLSNSIDWVKPLYIKLRPEDISSNTIGFVNNYITSGVLNSGVISEGNTSFSNRIFSTEQNKIIAETFKHPSQVLGQNIVPATFSFYNPATPWGYSGFNSVAFAESTTYTSILGFAPIFSLKGVATAGNSGVIAFDANTITNTTGENYTTRGYGPGYFLYPSVYIKSMSTNLSGLLQIYFVNSTGPTYYKVYSGVTTLAQTWTKYSYSSGIDGNVFGGDFYGKLMIFFQSYYSPGALTKSFMVDAPSVYLAPSGVYLETPPWSLGTKLSGLVSPSYMSENAQLRLFSSSGIKTQVEALNLSGYVAPGKVPNNALVESRIVYLDGAGELYDMGNIAQQIKAGAIADAAVTDGKLSNTNILYLETDDSVKKVDGTATKLKHTVLSGVQEYRQIWSSSSTKAAGPTGDASVEYYWRTSTSGTIAYIPFMAVSGTDTLVRVSANLKTSNAAVPAFLSVSTCYPTCSQYQNICSSTSTTLDGQRVSGVINLGTFDTGAGAIDLRIGCAPTATVSGWFISVEIGNH